MDGISELPDNAIENIIKRLPSLRDAVRTSILSRKWRYKWTTLPTLFLNEFLFGVYGDQKDHEKFPGIVKSILLQHNGPLHTFQIDIPKLTPQGNAEITLAIHVALMKGVQELIVYAPGCGVVLDVLPSFLFCCGEQLRMLELRNCAYNPPFGFRGFSNLKILHLSLCLQSLDVSATERLSSFVSSCPKLREIDINWLYTSHDLNFRTPSLEYCRVGGLFRSIIFQEAPNLVSLEIKHVTREIFLSNDYMLQLFSNTAKLKYLTLGGNTCHVLGTDCAPRKLPTILHNLEIFHVDGVDLGQQRPFHCILSLIMSSPNLERLQIRVSTDTNFGDVYVESGDYKDCFFMQLRSVRMMNLGGSNAELKLIKILLANSPLLQNLSTEIQQEDKKASFSEKLMQFPRASPIAQVSCITKEM